MQISLNKDQAKGLSNFFFDVAKGVTLGGLSSIVVTDLWQRLVFIVATFMIVYTCITTALTLLKGIR